MQVPAIAERQDAYPLSPLQHSILFHHLAEGQRNGFAVQQLDVTLRDAVEVATLAQAWEIVAAAHPVLRTRLRWDGAEGPRQEVMAPIGPPVEVHELSSASEAAGAAAIDEFLASDRLRGFDLGAAPLWRVTFLHVGDAKPRMVWTYSQAILDGSAAAVMRDVVAAYQALSQGRLPALAERPSYREYIAGLQRDWPSRAPAARAYWRQHLGGVAKPTALAVRGTETSSPATAGTVTQRFQLSGSTDAAVRRACQAQGVGLPAFVHAAWAIVLSAFTGEDDVVFGEMRPGRQTCVPGAEIVGQRINTLPVRAKVSGDRALASLLRDLDERQAAAGQFEDTPPAEIAASSDMSRGSGLFDSLVIVSDADDHEAFDGLGAVAERVVVHARMDVAVTIRVNLASRIAFALSFDGVHFDAVFARRVTTLLKRLLYAMATRPAATLGQLPRLPASDERDLAAFNATAAVNSGPGCVHHAVEAQVDRTPDAVALFCRGETLTYRELDARANRVAAGLIEHGAGPNRVVGIFVDRSLDMVAGLLGILKAGGAYMPLDPAYPAERLAMMAEDAKPSVLLTVERLRAGLPPADAQVICLDRFVADPLPRRVETTVRPEDLVYVFFTSGSTGRPKGVQVEHRNVINSFAGIDQVLGTEPGVWLALAGISFDISVLELFWTLSRGFRVVIEDAALRPATALDAARSHEPHRLYDFDLREQVRLHGATHLQCTPSLLERFALESGGIEALGSMRHLLIGGEALPAALVDRIVPHLSGTLHNMYGPTETTIWSTSAVVAVGQPITIGRPLANTTIHIRDRSLRPLPIGVAGELLIGGAGVSRGYVGRPELTEERFVRDPETGERLYRTGDLAAWRSDGQLSFHGRIDHQVKILGYRVELEEIDSVIGEHPAVRECVTVAHYGSAADVRLISYVTLRAVGREAEAGSAVEDLAPALRQYAQRRLPAFMVPSAVVTLPSMPMTPNGKADRRALAQRGSAKATTRSSANERERAILSVMQELVGREVGVDANFFEAGADSLLLLQATEHLGARLGRRVTLAEVLAHPTASALAGALTGADADAQSVDQGQQRAQQRQDAMRRRRTGSRPG